MTIPRQTTVKAANTEADGRWDLAGKVSRFIQHLLEMLVAMGAGMAIFHLLARLIPASSSYAEVSDPETDLHTIAMMVFMTVPMVGWMIVRGHGWRHSTEMAVAMSAPTVAIILLCQLIDLSWLADVSGPAMFLGMITAMLYRRDHYTAALPMAAGENACHAG